MSSQPWEADRPLTPQGVQAAITSVFPVVDAGSARHLGSGFEFDVYLTADGWVFRFPRRGEYQTLFDTEARVLGLVSDVLPPAIHLPRVELWGRPAAGFPYRFGGHRLIQGVPADTLGPDMVTLLAVGLAEALRAIHSIPVKKARAAGLGEPDPAEEEARWAWLQEGLSYASQLHGLDPAIHPALEWAGQATLPPPRFEGPLRLIHHDLKPDHLIVDPKTAGLAGILDWPEARLGDPATDFAGVVTTGGWRLAEEVEKRYQLPLGTGFSDRLRFYARLLSVIWLAAAEVQGSDLTRPTRWVKKAFDQGANPPGRDIGP